MIHTDIKDGIREAMKARNVLKLTVLRGLSSAFTNENVAKKRKPDELLNDEEALLVISREAKKRKDSIEQFKNGGREDLAENETAELAILQEFLPKLMSMEEIKKVVEAKIRELGVSDKTGIGRLMGVLMAELRGKADGGDVKKVVESVLQ